MKLPRTQYAGRVTTGMALLLAGCARPERAPGTPPAGTTALAAGASISLTRGACHGTCPIYRVSIAEDGTVVFEGGANVQLTGVSTGSTPRDSVLSLFREFDSAGYDRLADRYVNEAPGCGAYATDLPTITLSLTRDGRTKRVEYDQGCRGAPAALAMLARRVDQVAGSMRWIGPRR
jgi:hypothetical protein